MKTFVEKSREKFLWKYIDVFSALYVEREKWLAPREKEYFIGLVLMNYNKIDLVSRSANSYLENSLGFKNRGVSIYRGKLRKKDWIIQTPTGITLPPAFDYKGKVFPTEMNFKFKLSYTRNAT